MPVRPVIAPRAILCLGSNVTITNGQQKTFELDVKVYVLNFFFFREGRDNKQTKENSPLVL